MLLESAISILHVMPLLYIYVALYGSLCKSYKTTYLGVERPAAAAVEGEEAYARATTVWRRWWYSMNRKKQRANDCVLRVAERGSQCSAVLPKWYPGV